MIEWSKLMKGRFFITDLGANQISVIEGKETTVGRYAVWSPVTNSESHQIVEIGECLDYLVEKYRVSRDRICSIT